MTNEQINTQLYRALALLNASQITLHNALRDMPEEMRVSYLVTYGHREVGNLRAAAAELQEVVEALETATRPESPAEAPEPSEEAPEHPWDLSGFEGTCMTCRNFACSLKIDPCASCDYASSIAPFSRWEPR
jgi:hypothetical protein